MCFAQQQHAIFWHRNFQKWSQSVRFVNLYLKTRFAPQSGAIFWFSFGQVAPLRRFSEPICRPSRPTNHWKNATFRDLPNMSGTCKSFLLTLSLSLATLLFYPSFPYRRKFGFLTVFMERAQAKKWSNVYAIDDGDLHTRFAFPVTIFERLFLQGANGP